MAIKQKGEKVTIGDFIQLSDNPATYLEVTGGLEPHWEGIITNDPTKWIGSPTRYRPASIIAEEKAAAEAATE